MPFTLKEFGQYIKQLRVSAGLTHDDVERLSRAYGYPVAQPTQSKLERGAGRDLPGGRIVIGLAYAYGETPSSLLNFSEEEKRSTPQPKQLSSQARRIAERLDDLPDELLNQAIQFIQQLLKLSALNRQRNLFYLQDVLALVEEGLDPAVSQQVWATLQKAGLTGKEIVAQALVGEDLSSIQEGSDPAPKALRKQHPTGLRKRSLQKS